MVEEKLAKQIVEKFPDLKEAFASSLAQEILTNSVVLKNKIGDQLFLEADPVQVFPLVLQGSIKVYKSDPNGKSVILYEVNPGEGCVLSTSSLLGQTRYPASGKVEADLVAVGIPKELFYKMVDHSSAFRRYVFQIFSERLSHLLEMIEEVSFKKLDQRLAKYLLEKAPEIKTTHQKIADDLGSSREIISRLLKRFEKEGYLNLEREKILVSRNNLLKSLVNL